MAQQYSIERHIRIYDDASGEYLEVAPDADGLDLVELRSVTGKDEIAERVVMTRQQAELVANALVEYCTDGRNFEPNNTAPKNDNPHA
jgi:hypothetical protein